MRRLVSRPRAKIVLTEGPVQILVSDPPWHLNDQLNGKGASYKYKTMPLLDIARFPLPPLAQQSVLFMWRLATMQEEALFVMKCWGFRPYSEVVWEKMTKHGKDHFGQGHLTRASHETCLVGVRNKARLIAPAVRNERSRFSGKVRDHSEKPEEFYQLVQRLYPSQVKHEMFARRTRPGWQQSGDQLGVLDQT